MNLTIKSAKALLRPLNMTLIRDAEADEYRVNHAGGSEATAYYTNDLKDAFKTAIVMHDHRVTLTR
jgi:hypothetical protein